MEGGGRYGKVFKELLLNAPEQVADAASKQGIEIAVDLVPQTIFHLLVNSLVVAVCCGVVLVCLCPPQKKNNPE